MAAEAGRQGRRGRARPATTLTAGGVDGSRSTRCWGWAPARWRRRHWRGGHRSLCLYRPVRQGRVCVRGGRGAGRVAPWRPAAGPSGQRPCGVPSGWRVGRRRRRWGRRVRTDAPAAWRAAGRRGLGGAAGGLGRALSLAPPPAAAAADVRRQPRPWRSPPPPGRQAPAARRRRHRRRRRSCRRGLPRAPAVPPPPCDTMGHHRRESSWRRRPRGMAWQTPRRSGCASCSAARSGRIENCFFFILMWHVSLSADGATLATQISTADAVGVGIRPLRCPSASPSHPRQGIAWTPPDRPPCGRPPPCSRPTP